MKIIQSMDLDGITIKISDSHQIASSLNFSDEIVEVPVDQIESLIFRNVLNSNIDKLCTGYRLKQRDNATTPNTNGWVADAPVKPFTPIPAPPKTRAWVELTERAGGGFYLDFYNLNAARDGLGGYSIGDTVKFSSASALAAESGIESLPGVALNNENTDNAFTSIRYEFTSGSYSASGYNYLVSGISHYDMSGTREDFGIAEDPDGPAMYLH